MAVFQAAVVAVQAFFDSLCGFVRTEIGIMRHALGLKGNSGGEMQRAIGSKSGSFGFDNDMTGHAAIKISFDGCGDAVRYLTAQGVTDIEIFTRNTQSHGTPR